MKKELVSAIENIKDEDKIKKFLMQLTHEGVHDLFEVLDRSTYETQILWQKVYEKTFDLNKKNL